MRFLPSLALLCSGALGAPYPHSDIAVNQAASAAAVFKVERLYAGGQPQSNWNYVTFAVQVTGGAAFAQCSIVTDTGPKVPTVEKTACSSANAVKWSLEPMGTGMMHFNVWWEFTSHAHLYGGVHMYQSWFKERTVQDGSKVQEYVGPRNFTLETTMKTTQPGE